MKYLKRVTHSTMRILHHTTSSECVNPFPCSLLRLMPNHQTSVSCNIYCNLVVVSGFLALFKPCDWSTQKMLSCDCLQCFQYCNQSDLHAREVSVHKESLQLAYYRNCGAGIKTINQTFGPMGVLARSSIRSD